MSKIRTGLEIAALSMFLLAGMCGLQLSNYNLRHELETLKGQVQEGNRRLMDDNQRLMNELKAFSRQQQERTSASRPRVSPGT